MTTNSDAPQGPASAVDPATAVIRSLVAAAGWMRFFAILGFISVGLMILAALVFLVAGSLPYGGPGRLVGVLYIVFAFVYLIPLLPLHRAAGTAASLRATPNHDIAAQALSHQAQFWRRLGILTIIGLVLSVLGGIITIVVTALGIR